MWRPPSTPDPNSIAAAVSVELTAPAQRLRVLHVVDTFGPVSAEAIQDALHLGGNSVRPRIVELEQDRLIAKAGQGRTRSGRRCYVYAVTVAGAIALGRDPRLELWTEPEVAAASDRAVTSSRGRSF
jgi:hypothetical protein